jgi:hypothetical protein
MSQTYAPVAQRVLPVGHRSPIFSGKSGNFGKVTPAWLRRKRSTTRLRAKKVRHNVLRASRRRPLSGNDPIARWSLRRVMAWCCESGCLPWREGSNPSVVTGPRWRRCTSNPASILRPWVTVGAFVSAGRIPAVWGAISNALRKYQQGPKAGRSTPDNPPSA